MSQNPLSLMRWLTVLPCALSTNMAVMLRGWLVSYTVSAACCGDTCLIEGMLLMLLWWLAASDAAACLPMLQQPRVLLAAEVKMAAWA